jgi:hypothetical protein
LVGQGGEGEDDEDRGVAEVWWWRRGLLGSAPFAAVLKRRRWCAEAILGSEGGPAALRLIGLSSLSLLMWGIFLDLGMVVNAAAPPSGFVPGGSGGGRARRSTTDGGERRTRSRLAIFYRVLCAKIRGSCVNLLLGSFL